MADSLQFSVGADTSQFASGIDGVIGKLAAMAAAFISAQAVIEAFNRAIDLGGRLHDLSTRTGETAGNLALLERAFENTSVGADKLGPAIAKMQKSIIDAADGSGKTAEAFEKLAISMAELQGKSPTEQLELIGERLANVVDPAQRAALAMAIFGRSGSELLPVLLNFRGELDLARSQLGSLPEMLNRTAASVDGLGDNLAAIKNKTTELAYGFLSEVVPALEMFTSKLAGVDAASIGAGMAQALVGAFVQPMAAAELLGQTLLLGVKQMGNEFVYQVNYWSQLMLNTFAALGSSTIPMLGENMRGAFEMAVASFGTVLVSTISGALESLRSVAGFLGFGDELDVAITKVQAVQETLDSVMAEGAARISESAGTFGEAFEIAKANSTVIREDIFGANTLADEIAGKFSSLQTYAKAAMDEFRTGESLFSPTGGSIAEFGGGSVFGEDGVELYSETAAALDRMSTSTAGLGDSAKNAGAAVAAAVAALNQQISTLAGLNPNQAVGQSASAREVQSIQEQIKALEAAGKPVPDSLRARLQLHQDIATGVNATAADKEEAHQRALDEWFKDPSQSLQDLENQALKDILAEKGKTPGETPEEKAKQEEAGKKEEDKPKTIQSVADAMLKLLQKIEPRIPTYNLA
jgi:hypothetical protein